MGFLFYDIELKLVSQFVTCTEADIAISGDVICSSGGCDGNKFVADSGWHVYWTHSVLMSSVPSPVNLDVQHLRNISLVNSVFTLEITCKISPWNQSSKTIIQQHLRN